MPLPTIPSGNVASAIGGGYEVDNSCRFNAADNPKLYKTPSSTGDEQKWTLSLWIKRCKFGAYQTIWGAQHPSDTSDVDVIRFTNGDQLQFFLNGASSANIITTQVFRDPSAFYHLVFAVDTTQSTAANRVKIYVNGSQVDDFGTETYPSINHNTYNNTDDLRINIAASGDSASEGDNDCYLAEVVGIDGSQLAATSFGEFDEDSPTIWKPKDVSDLTFGTNGYYLDFEDSSNLGNDANGGTDFTEVNLAATDQSSDSPTNNFCTLNPLIPSGLTYSEGNLGSARTDSGNRAGYGTFGVTAGKWYWEVKCVAAGTASAVGIGKETNMGNANQGNSQYVGSETNDIGYYTDGNINESASSIDSETSWTDGDIISVAMDLDNNKVYFAKNGTWQNSADPSAGSNGYSITNSSDTFFPQISHSGATDASALSNFGAPPFSISSSNSDPNGYGSFEYGTENFYALCTKNLAEFGG